MIHSMLGAAALLSAAPALAQAPKPQPIAVAADAPFRHDNSGLTLPATLAGLPRTRILENEAPQLDILAAWARGDDAELSVYVYRSTAGSVPVWFDRAVWAIETRGLYGTPVPAQPPVAFRPPGATADTGLLAAWTAGSGSYTGTGVALVPFGEWLVKLRYSSKSEDGAAVAALLRAAVAGIGWPATLPPAPPAQPIAACAAPLAFKGKARSAPADMTNALIGALSGVVASSASATPPASWCRDAATLPMAGVYRPDGAVDRYLIALSDAGRGVSVGPGLGGLFDPKAKPRWAVNLVLPGQTVNFPQQDRLPTPARALELLREQPVSSASTWGAKRQVTLPSSQR